MYHYNAKVLKVVDGDTVDLDVDLGFCIHTKVRFRLARIDAPEVKGPARTEGLAAKALLKQLLGSECEVRSEKTESDLYGRWIANLYVGESCINDEMVAAGAAVEKTYT